MKTHVIFGLQSDFSPGNGDPLYGAFFFFSRISQKKLFKLTAQINNEMYSNLISH